MTKTKETLRKGDRVYCVLNKQIKGVITNKNNFHGCWLYQVKPDNEETFYKKVKKGTHSPFLYWQLKKI